MKYKEGKLKIPWDSVLTLFHFSAINSQFQLLLFQLHERNQLHRAKPQKVEGI